MSADDMEIRIRLSGARAASTEAKGLRAEIVGIGRAEEKAAGGAQKWGRATNTVGKHTRRLHGSVVSAGKSIGGVRERVYGLTGALGFGAGLGLIGAIHESSARMQEQQVTNAKLSASLKSSGGAAHVSAEGLQAAAEAAQRKNGIDSEQVKLAESTLLSFRSVHNETGRGNKIFDRATKAAENLSVKYGKSLPASATALGKALNDPVKGMGLLSRMGIKATDAEAKQIKTLVAHGKLQQAQKIVLDKVAKAAGGQADAYGKTLPAALGKMKFAMQDLGASILTKLTPTLTRLAQKAATFVGQMQSGTGAGGRFRDKLEQVWKAAKPVVFWFGRAAKNVFNFAAKHQSVVKVGLAVWGVDRALRALGFRSAIKGMAKLAWWATKLAASKWGARMVSSLLDRTGLGALVARAAVPLGRFKASAVAKMRIFGRAAGSAFSKAFSAGLIFAAADIASALQKAISDALPGGKGTPTIPGSSKGGPKRINIGPGAPTVGDFLGINIPDLIPKIGARPSGVAMTPAMGSPAGAPSGVSAYGGGDVIHHTVVQIGDRPVWEAWDRHSRKKANRK